MKPNYAIAIILLMFYLSIGTFQSQKKSFPIGIWSPPDISVNYIASPADYDGDGETDISVKTSGGYWLIDESSNGFGYWDHQYAEYGGLDAIPVPGDYDGDEKIDLSVKTHGGSWLIDYADNGLGGWDNVINFNYGGTDAHPVPADYDNDGITDIAVKKDNGDWLIDIAANGFGSWDMFFHQFGGADAHAVPGDYNGDGILDLSVKVDDGRWLIANGLSGWQPPFINFNYGGPSAIPAPGDYDGDGKTDIAVKDGEVWKIDYASDGFGSFNIEFNGYGDITAEPVPADYDGDGKADLSIKTTTNGMWLIDKSSLGLGGWDMGISLSAQTPYQFLIGNSPPYYINDLIKFQKVKEANVDFLISPDVMFMYDNHSRIYSYLDLVKKSGLKVMLSSHHVASYQDPDLLPTEKQELIDKFRNNLPNGLDDAIFGIFLGDEPVFNNFTNVNKWTNFFRSNFPEKKLYYNLMPRYWGGVNSNTDYENYVNQYVNQNITDYVSFDHYPFNRGNEPFYPSYFYNLKTFKDKLTFQPFWFVIQSHEDYAPEPYAPKLRFLTSTAIAYNAQGLLYWDYKNGFEKNHAHYAAIRDMNKFLKEVVGPVVLNYQHVTTLHKADTYMNQGYPFGLDELLDLNSFGVIKDVNNHNILLSLFENHNQNLTEYYIWIVNKDTELIANSTQLKLNGSYDSSYISPRVNSYTSPNNAFTTIGKTYNNSTNTTSIIIPELFPGEGVMLKVLKRNLIIVDPCIIEDIFAAN
ncbi:MAG: VCBS repeat-containing protein [Chryseobacterium sp.]|nr:VCBS repeat-containing protein [Chryseobacterium sp.]